MTNDDSGPVPVYGYDGGNLGYTAADWAARLADDRAAMVKTLDETAAKWARLADALDEVTRSLPYIPAVKFTDVKGGSVRVPLLLPAAKSTPRAELINLLNIVTARADRISVAIRRAVTVADQGYATAIETARGGGS